MFDRKSIVAETYARALLQRAFEGHALRGGDRQSS